MADVLVVGAHPDDAEFGMGATLCRLVREGHTVSLCVMTGGEAGSHGNIKLREAEMRAAAKALGADLVILGIADCEVRDTPEARKRLAAVIRKERPAVVFAPWYGNPGSHKEGSAHPDHLAAGALTRFAIRYARFRNLAGVEGEAWRVSHVLYYMLGQDPTVFVDVSEDMERFKALISLHESQMALRDNGVMDFLYDKRKALGGRCGVEYAEGFHSPDPMPLSLTGLFR